MKRFLISIMILSALLVGENSESNATASVKAKESNSTVSPGNKLDEEVKKQIEREKKYAKEQTFYQGSEYNLKEVEVDPETVSKVPVLNPDYDFDMDDVYSD